MTRACCSAREADRRAGIIGEDQEGAAIGDHAAVQRHAVHRRGHAELADAVIDVAAGIIRRGQRLDVLGFGVVRAGEVGRAADRRRERALIASSAISEALRVATFCGSAISLSR